MLLIFLALPIFLCLGPPLAFSQEDTVREALRGTSPITTITTGIGHVVQPVGIPVVTPPTGPVGPTVTAPTPAPKPAGKPTGPADKYRFEEPKVDGKYELGEVTQKKAKAAGQTEKTTQVSEGERSASPSYLTSYADTSEKPLPRPGKSKVIRVPTSELPRVEKIPYH